MSNWRDEILREFTLGVTRLTLVADPDALLLEEKILENIRERGFELINFEDHVAFRFVYESQFRSCWDRGLQTDLVVVLRARASDLDSLPFDLLQAGRRLSFSLGDIFPNLSYPVVTALDRGDLDSLYDAQGRYAPGQLGDNATKEFVLRHVFEIAPELIKGPADLLRVLLRRHYLARRIPSLLEECFVRLLRHDHVFDDWPLDAIVSDREAFFAFLQERWPVFLDHLAGQPDMIREHGKVYDLAFEGPLDLPFDHQDVRIYLDNLFLEGMLHPVSHEHAGRLFKTWAGVGIQTDTADDQKGSLVKLIDSLHSSIPVADARYEEWFRFARGWAKLTILAHGQKDSMAGELIARFNSMQNRVDASFTSWLGRRYAGLINLPPVPPVMLHHLPRFLGRYAGEASNIKIALLIMDGMALDQWMIVQEALAARQPDFRFRNSAVFAWAPSLTSVSRQAVFAGRPPILFPNSIQTADKECSLWRQFWADQGLSSSEVAYAKGLGAGGFDQIEEMIAHPKVKVAGLVIDKVDKIMHGMELGTAGMHNQVRQWAQQPYLAEFLNLLLDHGFHVFLTSDHGNIEAEGCGLPAEGAAAELRGERVRIYSDKLLRDQVKERFPAALEWPPVGLPDTFLPLVAPARQAFAHAGERIVCHGGISIEELIIPFVQVERMNDERTAPSTTDRNR